MPENPDDAGYPSLSSIQTKTFHLGLKGYNVKEVDSFLATLVIEFAELRAALEQARNENEVLRSQLSS
jgi:DivIVA domain-containing protein